MAVLSFWRQWIGRAFSRSLGLGDLAGSLVGNAATVWVHYDPRWQSALADLRWQVPIFALGGALALRLLVAPYELWKQQKDRADAAEALLGKLRDPKQDELEEWVREHFDPVYTLVCKADLASIQQCTWDYYPPGKEYSIEENANNLSATPSAMTAEALNLPAAERIFLDTLNRYTNMGRNIVLRSRLGSPPPQTISEYADWRKADAEFIPILRAFASRPGYPILRDAISANWGVYDRTTAWPAI